MKNYLPLYLCLSLIACDVTELRDPTLVVESNELISLDVVDADFNLLQGKQTLSADSGSLCFLKAVLGPKIDGAQEILFSTTGGVLTNVGVLPTNESQNTLRITPSDREIVIQLNTLDVPNEKVVVSATTGKVSDLMELSFGISYPYDFQIKPVNNTSVLKTEEVELRIEALVKHGTMSEGQHLKVSVTSDEGVVLDYPQFVKIVNQKAIVKIINSSETSGKATVFIELAVALDKTITKEFAITYE